MPELPEVETVRRGLEPALVGARLVRVEARRPDLRFRLPDRFVQRLTGACVGPLHRRGKFILAPLDSGETLLVHLGMTGRFEVEGGAARTMPGDFALAAPADPRHAHIVLETDAGAAITYFDARRFGFMDLIDTDTWRAHPRFARMGPEPLEEDFDAAWLACAFAGRRQAVKPLLLDQSIVAGLGNIYVCEALHRARISPTRAAGTLGSRALERVAAAVRTVLAEAIAAGGSTLRDYAGVEGAMGYFQHAFAVYGRAGEPCLRAGCAGPIERIVQAGRATFHCLGCQR